MEGFSVGFVVCWIGNDGIVVLFSTLPSPVRLTEGSLVGGNVGATGNIVEIVGSSVGLKVGMDVDSSVGYVVGDGLGCVIGLDVYCVIDGVIVGRKDVDGDAVGLMVGFEVDWNVVQFVEISENSVHSNSVWTDF